MKTKEEFVLLRKQVKECVLKGLNNSEISRRLGVTRDFVIKWRKGKDISKDKRGWINGRKRKYSENQEREIIEKRKSLQETAFFIGAKAIKQKLKSDQSISLSFIKRVVKSNNLQTHRKKFKGKSEYQLYPKQLIEDLGGRHIQIDFIGPRYLNGSKEPIHFLSCKYIKPFKRHVFIRIQSETTTETIKALYQLFKDFGLVDLVQVDNDAAFKGFTIRKRTVGRFVKWLCCMKIKVLFNAPRSPWNNGSVEGGNSVFDYKFWQKYEFKSLNELDDKLQEFNQEYSEYLESDSLKKRLIMNFFLNLRS
jgi:transposase